MKALTHMWSNDCVECFDTIVMKPYFVMLAVETMTVSRSMKIHSDMNSFFTETFFVNTTGTITGLCYFYFVDPSIFFFILSSVDPVNFFKTVLFPFFVFPKFKVKSSRKHSFPTYSFWYLEILAYSGILKTGIKIHLLRSFVIKFLTSHSTLCYFLSSNTYFLLSNYESCWYLKKGGDHHAMKP